MALADVVNEAQEPCAVEYSQGTFAALVNWSRRRCCVSVGI